MRIFQRLAAPCGLCRRARRRERSPGCPLPRRADGRGQHLLLSRARLINPLLAAFSKETGIKTNVVFATNGLIERLAAEGKNSPADLLLTHEFGPAAAGRRRRRHAAGALGRARQRDPREAARRRRPVVRPDARARVVYASKDRVKQDAITYEELADPKWRGKICIRSGQHTYNVALVASMIAHHGEEETEKWLTGLKANLARKPGRRRPRGGARRAGRACAISPSATPTTWRRC